MKTPINKIKKEILVILAIIIIALVIRLLLSPVPGYIDDVNCYNKWAITGAKYGISNIYKESRCNYPPFYLYILMFTGKIYLSYPELLSTSWANILIKIPSIVADIVTAILIFLIAKRFDLDLKKSCLLMIFYLFNPGIIYNSSYWGQTDSFVTMLLFASLVLLVNKKEILSYMFFTLAFLTKMQSVFFFPLFILFIFYNFRYRGLVKFLATAMITTFSVLMPFILNNTLDGPIGVYKKSIGFYPYVSIDAYNLWYLIGGSRQMRDTIKLFDLISIRDIGLLLVGIIYIFIIIYYLAEQSKEKNMFFLYSIVIFSFFMLSTQIHERYLFPFFAFFLIIYFQGSILRIIFWVVSYAYFMSLVGVLPFLQNFIYKDYPFGREIIAIINLISLVVLIYFIFPTKENIIKSFKEFIRLLKNIN